MLSTQKRNLFLWTLYDFANSFVYIAFFLFFSQWIVIEQGIPDLWFNLSFTASSIILLFFAPLIGIKLDQKWKKLPGLRLSTIGILFFYSLSAFSAIQESALTSLILFSLGFLFFSLSFIFYVPLINEVSSSQKKAGSRELEFLEIF